MKFIRKLKPEIYVPVLLVILLLWIAISLAQEDEAGSTIYYVSVIWLLCMILLLYSGNLIIYRALDAQLNWEDSFRKRLLWQLVLGTLFSIFCINLTYYLFKVNFTDYPPDNYQMILLNIYAAIFTLPVVSIILGIYFMRRWRKVAIEKEMLQREQISSQLSSLRSHLDPHFLFNTLNILHSLIDSENEVAADFLEKFTEVYRYVLKNRESELVTLDTELQFLESYLFILTKRFDQQLIVDLKIEDSYRNHVVPPLALQMLVENALKHNKLTYKSPLQIDLRISNGYLVVKNNLQPKSQLGGEENTGFGLENIQKRYELLSNKEVLIEENSQVFKVSLPLLDPVQYESSIN